MRFKGFKTLYQQGKVVSIRYLPQIFEELKVPVNTQKEKARHKRYEQSDKAKARRKRYLEKHQTEITEKRKEKKEIEYLGKLKAFCRHWSLDFWLTQRYIEMKKNGVDIWDRSVRYAKFIDIFETGKYPQEMRISMVAKRRTVPGSDQFHLPKQPVRNPSARSIDYY